MADVLRAMLETGEAITFAGLARRAGVSVSLLYADRDLAAKVAEARDRQPGWVGSGLAPAGTFARH